MDQLWRPAAEHSTAPKAWDDWQGVKGVLTAWDHPPHRPFLFRLMAGGGLQGQRGEPTLTNSRPVPLFQFTLIFVPLSMVCYDAACQCASWSTAHMVGLSSQEGFSRGVNGRFPMHATFTHFVALLFFFSCNVFVPFSAPQLFVIVVWNFELYMIPLALLLPLVWNYILIASGKDTRQDVVRSPTVWFLRHNCHTVFCL